MCPLYTKSHRRKAILIGGYGAEILHCTMRPGIELAITVKAHNQHAGGLGGIQLFADIRKKQDVVRRQANGGGNFGVGGRLALATRAGVKIARKQRRQVAMRAVPEQKLLREDGARGINVKLLARTLP